MNSLFDEARRLGKPFRKHKRFPALMLVVWLALATQMAHGASLVLNGGFETGDFSSWTTSGNFSQCIANTGPNYAHSGTWGAKMGPGGTLGYLSQTLTTTPGQLYVLSFWLNCSDDPEGITPNEFTAAWNGTNLVDLVDFGPFGWTNCQYVVTATSNSTVLAFGFRDDPSFLGFDDVTVSTPPPPSFLSLTRTGTNITFTWSCVPTLVYQVQSSTNLATTNWSNLGGTITATSFVMTTTDTNAAIASPRRFYRLRQLP